MDDSGLKIRRILSTPFYQQHSADELAPVVCQMLTEAQILPSPPNPVKVTHLLRVNEFFDCCLKENVFSKDLHTELFSQISQSVNKAYFEAAKAAQASSLFGSFGEQATVVTSPQKEDSENFVENYSPYSSGTQTFSDPWPKIDPKDDPSANYEMPVFEAVVVCLESVKRICTTAEIADFIRKHNLRGPSLKTTTVAGVCSIFSKGLDSVLLNMKPGYTLRKHVEQGVVALPPGKTLESLTVVPLLKRAREEKGREQPPRPQKEKTKAQVLPKGWNEQSDESDDDDWATKRGKKKKDKKMDTLDSAIITAFEHEMGICHPSTISAFLAQNWEKGEDILPITVQTRMKELCRGPDSALIFMKPGYALRRHISEGLVSVPEMREVIQNETVQDLGSVEVANSSLDLGDFTRHMATVAGPDLLLGFAAMLDDLAQQK